MNLTRLTVTIIVIILLVVATTGCVGGSADTSTKPTPVVDLSKGMNKLFHPDESTGGSISTTCASFPLCE